MSAQGNSGPTHLRSVQPTPPPPDGGDDAVRERLARLEEAIGGLKDRLTLMTAIIGFILATLLALGAYSLNRMDRIEDKINDLPGKINANLQQLTGTLANSITAAKQTPPQVILMQSPQPAPAKPSR